MKSLFVLEMNVFHKNVENLVKIILTLKSKENPFRTDPI